MQEQHLVNANLCVKIVHAYGLGEGFVWIRVNQAKQQLSVK